MHLPGDLNENGWKKNIVRAKKTTRKYREAEILVYVTVGW